MCGMCGNSDDNPDNDMTMANGVFVGNLPNAGNLVGDSYVVADPAQTNTTWDYDKTNLSFNFMPCVFVLRPYDFCVLAARQQNNVETCERNLALTVPSVLALFSNSRQQWLYPFLGRQQQT
jgi:hypothetical protein